LQNEAWREYFHRMALDPQIQLDLPDRFNCQTVQEAARRVMPAFISKVQRAR
jgi:hypothetical protein